MATKGHKISFERYMSCETVSWHKLFYEYNIIQNGLKNIVCVSPINSTPILV